MNYITKISGCSDHGLIYQNEFLEEGKWDWRDGSVTKNTVYFSRGPESIPINHTDTNNDL